MLDSLNNANIFNFYLVAAFLTAIVTAVATVTWKITNQLFFRFGEKFRVCETELQCNFGKSVFDKISHDKVFLHIVKFGTDEYLSTLASELEKFDRRLRNKIRPATWDNENLSLLTMVPLHKFLGTQFKFFLTAPSFAEAEQIVSTLKECPNVSDCDISMDSTGFNVYFLSTQFATTTTIDKFKNNFLSPI
jgi:hypothetical protein